MEEDQEVVEEEVEGEVLLRLMELRKVEEAEVEEAQEWKHGPAEAGVGGTLGLEVAAAAEEELTCRAEMEVEEEGAWRQEPGREEVAVGRPALVQVVVEEVVQSCGVVVEEEGHLWTEEVEELTRKDNRVT